MESSVTIPEQFKLSNSTKLKVQPKVAIAICQGLMYKIMKIWLIDIVKQFTLVLQFQFTKRGLLFVDRIMRAPLYNGWWPSQVCQINGWYLKFRNLCNSCTSLGMVSGFLFCRLNSARELKPKQPASKCKSRLASSPGHSQILSCTHRKKSGEGLGSKLRHGPEMVDSVSTNRVY